MGNVVGGSVIWNFDADDSKFNRVADKTRGTAKGLAGDLRRIDFRAVSTQASQAFGSIADGMARVAKVAAVTLVGGGGIGALFLKSAAQLERTNKSFEVLTGNAGTARKLFAQIKQFADETPFEFPELADAARTMLGFGVSSKVVFEQLQALGDISAATGADMRLLSLVFGQVNAAGRLMGQDVLQLVNNRIPITSMLAKRLGITTAEVRDRISEGNISAQVFNETLLSMSKRGGVAFRGTAELAQTMSGRFSTLKDTVMEFGRNLLGVRVDPELGLTIRPGGIFDVISKSIPRINESLKVLAPRLERAFMTVIDNGDTVVAVIYGLATAFVAAKVAAIGFAIVAWANPVTLGAAAIIELIAVLAFLYKRFEGVRNVVDGVVDVVNLGLLPTFRRIRDQAMLTVEAVKTVIDIFQIWKDRVTRLTSTIVDAIQAIPDAVRRLEADIRSRLDAVRAVFVNIFEDIKRRVTGTLNAITAFIDPWRQDFTGKLAQTFKAAADALIRYDLETLRRWRENLGRIGQALKDWGVQIVRDVVNVLETVVGALISFFTALPGRVAAAVSTAARLVGERFTAIVTTIAGKLEQVFTNVGSFFAALPGRVATTVTTAARAVGAFFTELPRRIGQVLTDTYNGVRNFFASLPARISGEVQASGTKIGDAAGNGVKSSFTNADKMRKIGQVILGGIGLAIGSILLAMVDLGLKVAGKIFEGITRGFPALRDRLASALYNAGRDIIQGLINGIRSKIGDVGASIGNIADGIKNRFKSALGIDSPSKVFADYGNNISEGLVLGLAKTRSMIRAEMSDLSMIASPNFDVTPVQSSAPATAPNINITLNTEGIVARSRSEWRDIMKDGIEAVNEELRARGIDQIGGGKIAGASTNG